MSIETPPHYTYFKVTGRYLRRVIDGPDADAYPDVVASTGTFTFTPSVPTYKDLSLPATFENVVQTGTLDAAGFLIDEQGRQGVTLMSGNSPFISPQGWTWSVTASVNGKQSAAFDLPGDIEPGEVVDLTVVSPATASGGTVIIVSEASRIAAEQARDQALGALDTLLEGVGPLVEDYLTENPPVGSGGGAVDSVAGKTGVIVLALADVEGLVTALAAKSDTSHTHSNYVPTTRTIAGKALSANVTLAKADVGLGSVDNTSDIGKPVSTATQAVLDAKAPLVGSDVIIRTTALNTWPARATGLTALGLTGYTGPVVWRHMASHGVFPAGTSPIFPSGATTTDDSVEWTVEEA